MRTGILLLIFGMLFIPATVFSQTLVTIGTPASTSSSSGPSSSTTAGDRNERHMCIYTAAELTNAGVTSATPLMSIGWEKTGIGHYYVPNLTIRVWLKHNASTTFAANPVFATETASATLVYETTTGTIPTAAGWINFPFNMSGSSFLWNGTQNLQVITEIIRPTDWTETGFLWRTISSTTNAAANANNTTATPSASLTRTGTRPQIRVGIPATGVDAALLSMPSPVSGPAGLQNIDVVLRNTGATTLTSATLNYTIDGGAPTAFNWSGTLAAGVSTTVTVANTNFSAGAHTVQVVVSNPNGGADADPSNNTVTKLMGTPMSGNYTIDKNSPTAGINYTSFNDFSTALSARGVDGHVIGTVVDNSGPYSEQVVFTNIPGLGASASIRIEGNGETITTPAAIIQNNGNPLRHVIRLLDVQYFTINNVDIDMFPGSTGFIGIHVLNSGNNITISNNNIDMGSASSTLLGAIVVNGDPAGNLMPGGNLDNISIHGNITRGGGYGVSVNGLASPLATNVKIYNNDIADFNSNGVYLRETSGAEVNNNKFDDNTTAAATTWNAIQVAQTANINARVFNNDIKVTRTTNSASAIMNGIYLFGGTGHRVYNNIIHDIKLTSGGFSGIVVRPANSAYELFFNTISIDDPASTNGSLSGVEEELSTTNFVSRNNIITIEKPTTGVKTGYWLATNTAFGSVVSDYNVFWVPGGNVAYRTHTTTPVPQPTLADWQTASGGDNNSHETSPQYQTGTVIPTSGVINGEGTPISGITTDILGVTRSNPPDPGAYEFAPPAGDASISAFELPAMPHCANTLDVQFVLTNVGSDPLNTVTINWSVNGVPQPVVNWAGPTLASGASTVVTLGTINVATNVLFDFSATTSNPNGFPDVNPANDNFIYTGYRNGFAGVYTINSGAPASVTNFQSFQAIADELHLYGVCAPVTVTVSGGPYNARAIFTSIPGTSAVNTVTLDGNSQVLQFNVANMEQGVLVLDGVTHMIVENLTVNSLHPTDGRGIHITNGASKLTIRNNNVNVSTTNSVSSSFGIIISGQNWLLNGSLSDSVVITGNTVRGGYSSIQLSGEHWTQPLTRITVKDNTTLDWYGFGIYLSYTNGCLVEGNTIRRPTRTNSGSDAVTPAGITIPAGSLDFKLSKNRMYDFHMAMPFSPTISRGVYLSGTGIAPTSGTIQNNLIYGMLNDGAQYGIQDNSVNGPINIFHNTIVLNSANGAGSSNTSAIRMSNTLTQLGTNITNNIFVVTRGGTGTKNIIDVSSASSVYTSNYNIAYFNPSGGTSNYGHVGTGAGTNYNTLADWQTGTGKDANSLGIDPVFTNPGTGDFTPTNFLGDGFLMNTSSVGVPDDINGVVRATNPDAGAFEFSPPSCVTADGGVASADATTFCSSGSATLSASGYSTGIGLLYQWQSSNDNFVTNIVDMPAQTNPASASTGVINATTYYRLRVTCINGPVVAYSNTVTLTVNQPAVITSHPVTQTVCRGTSATFAVAATGALSYQWQIYDGTNWNNVAGATSPTITVNSANHPQNTNPYRVVVTGQCGPVNSNYAVLYVNPLPTIHLNPSRTPELLPGQSVDITAVAVQGGGSYVWYKNGSVMPGVSGNVLAGLTVTDAGTYHVIYTDPNGCVNTSPSITVSALGSGNLFVYPSPNNGRFQVRFFNSEQEAAHISVFDAKGALVYKRQYTTALPYTQLDVELNNMPSGNYLVMVNGGGGRLIGSKWITVYR